MTIIVSLIFCIFIIVLAIGIELTNIKHLLTDILEKKHGNNINK